jgi:hypothetical protein
VGTERLHETLGHQPTQYGGVIEKGLVLGLVAQVEEAGQDFPGTVGMHGRQDQVPGIGHLERADGALPTPHLAHHHDIRIKPHDLLDMTTPILVLHGDLPDAFDLVLRRILECEEMPGVLTTPERFEGRHQRRGFPEPVGPEITVIPDAWSRSRLIWVPCSGV